MSVKWFKVGVAICSLLSVVGILMINHESDLRLKQNYYEGLIIGDSLTVWRFVDTLYYHQYASYSEDCEQAYQWANSHIDEVSNAYRAKQEICITDSPVLKIFPNLSLSSYNSHVAGYQKSISELDQVFITKSVWNHIIPFFVVLGFLLQIVIIILGDKQTIVVSKRAYLFAITFAIVLLGIIILFLVRGGSAWAGMVGSMIGACITASVSYFILHKQLNVNKKASDYSRSAAMYEKDRQACVDILKIVDSNHIIEALDELKFGSPTNGKRMLNATFNQLTSAVATFPFSLGSLHIDKNTGEFARSCIKAMSQYSEVINLLQLLFWVASDKDKKTFNLARIRRSIIVTPNAPDKELMDSILWHDTELTLDEYKSAIISIHDDCDAFLKENLGGYSIQAYLIECTNRFLTCRGNQLYNQYNRG